jgi:hypothetical protein
MRLIAKKIPYYGMPPRRLKPGDEFEASEAHGRLLVMVGAASAMTVPGGATGDEEQEQETPKPKRRYKRRDMQAEE